MRLFARALALLFLFGCLVATEPPATTAAIPGAPDDESADCSVAVNGASETAVPPGIPVVIEALVLLPKIGGAAIESHLRITSSDGNQVTLPLEALKKPDANADKSDERSLTWLLTPDASGGVAPGEYFVSMVLTHGKDEVARSAPAVIHVDPKAELNDDERNLIHLRYALARGDRDGASKRASQWLEKNPRSVDALVALGDLAVAADDLPGAMKRYQQALELITNPTTQPGEPPRAILARRSAVLRALLKRSAERAGNAPTSQPAGKEQ